VWSVALLSTVCLLCFAGVGQGYKVKGVEVENGGQLFRMIVRADGTLMYKHFSMKDPDRIVIDLPGATMLIPSVAYEGSEGDVVARVRTSQWKNIPGESAGRMVVDLQESAAYSVGSEDSLLFVTIKAKTKEPVLKAEARPKATVPPKRISLNVQEADIQTVLRSFSKFTGKNFVADKAVDGKVTVSLKDVPWLEALVAILDSQGLGYQEQGDIVRIGTKEELRKEMLDAAAAERKSEDLLPLVTQVVPLNFAKAEEMKETLKTMTSRRGHIDVDSRTNSLIVTDIESHLANIVALTERLDSTTPQVEIVAKMVDVDFAAARDMGIVWNATGMSIGGQDYSQSAGVDASIGEVLGTVRFGAIKPDINLDATLQTLESKNKANIISNPKITTVNNREASILVGKEIPLIVADEAGNAVVQLTTIGIGLKVTPHVNADKSITLDLHPEVSDLASQATVQGGIIINTSEADTRVLVKDGETVVIGGLIRANESTLKKGVPLLKDIPLLGYLFGSSSTVSSKRELVIFVTPRILE
jgi:type IV pilus assembly protein PilQ